jgi:hypothetical protein
MNHHPQPAHLEALASTPVDTRTPETRTTTCPTCGHRRRPKRETTDDSYRQSIWRQIVKYPERARTSGVNILDDLVALRDALNLVIDETVDICRSETWSASWAEIAERTHLTRQAAQQRWGQLGGARKPGGQPSNLR